MSELMNTPARPERFPLAFVARYRRWHCWRAPMARPKHSQKKAIVPPSGSSWADSSSFMEPLSRSSYSAVLGESLSSFFSPLKPRKSAEYRHRREGANSVSNLRIAIGYSRHPSATGVKWCHATASANGQRGNASQTNRSGRWLYCTVNTPSKGHPSIATHVKFEDATASIPKRMTFWTSGRKGFRSRHVRQGWCFHPQRWHPLRPIPFQNQCKFTAEPDVHYPTTPKTTIHELAAFRNHYVHFHNSAAN